MGAEIIKIFLNHLTLKDMRECFDDFVTLIANAIPVYSYGSFVVEVVFVVGL